MKVTAQATRSGDWWAVEVPEIDGLFTQTKRLDQVPAMVADAVAVLEGVDPDSVEVEVRPTVGSELDQLVDALAKLRREMIRAQSRLQEDQRRVVRRAVEQDRLSMRDAGALLGVSHQRIAQLLND